MNLLKSIFISALIMLTFTITVHSIYMLIFLESKIIWLATLFTSLPPTGFFVIAMLVMVTRRGLARTSADLPMLNVIVGLGVAFVFLSHLFYEVQSYLSIVYTGSLVVFWQLYIFWYSKFDRLENLALQVGKKLPDFEVSDVDTKVIHSKSFKGHTTLFLFYRGNWCPLCMSQISEIANQYRELEKRGVRVVLISPQPESFSDDLSKKHDAPMEFLVDKDNKSARLLNIHHEYGVPMGMQALGYASETVLPTVIITDTTGKIIFVDLTDNYRVRPEPSTFLAILDKL